MFKKWFGKKKEEEHVLTANQAYELAILSNEELKESRRKRLIEAIITQLKYGCLSMDCNKRSGCSNVYLNPVDIPYLESLGYKVEKKEEKLSTLSFSGRDNSIFSTYYTISWDLNKN